MNERRLSPVLRVGAAGSGLLLIAVIALVFIASRQVQDISQEAIGAYRAQTMDFIAERLESETAIVAERISNEFEVLSEWPSYLSKLVLDDRIALSREALMAKAYHVLKSAEGFNSVYVHMEPGGFHDDDSDYIGRDFSSELGALEIYWIRDVDGVRFEKTPDSSVKYEDALDSHGQELSFWYLCPKRTQTTCLSQPYTWMLRDGREVELLSLTYPIIRNERFVGITGGDINLQPLQKRFRELSSLLFSGQVDTALVTQQGRAIVTTERMPDLDNNLAIGLHSKSDSLKVVSPVNVLNQELLLVVELSILQVDTALSQTVSSLVDSSRKATLILVAIAAGVFVLVSAFALRYVLDRERRIQRNEAALRLANTELEKKVDEKTESLQKTVTSLQNAQDELIETGKIAALGRLVAGVSHELNTPLGNVLMSASQHQSDLQALKDKLEHGLQRSELERYVSMGTQSIDIVMRNAGRAANLVRSFKEISADQHSMRFKAFSLHQLFKDTLLVLEPSISKYNAKVMVSGAENIRCSSYPGALEQVLINLIQNALKHAFVERQDKTIAIDVEIQDDQVIIAVKDNGVGIEAQHIPHIFEPFFTTKMGAGGTGLGLSIVHNLVTQQLQGRIRVVSSPGVGTTFILAMPRKLTKACA